MVDVTKLVEFGNPDDECLPLLKCVCGREFPYWDNVISIYPDLAEPCDCGRRFIFSNQIVVYEVSDENTIRYALKDKNKHVFIVDWVKFLDCDLHGSGIDVSTSTDYILETDSYITHISSKLV